MHERLKGLRAERERETERERERQRVTERERERDRRYQGFQGRQRRRFLLPRLTKDTH